MLTTEQWEVVLPHLQAVRDQRYRRRGRPPKHTDQAIMEGVLWVLKTGARWQDLPERFPPYTTVYQRFRTWEKAGVIRRALQALARDLKRRGKLDLSECSIDATFIPAKKGGSVWVQPNGVRVRNSWRLQTALLLQWPATQRLLHPASVPSLPHP